MKIITPMNMKMVNAKIASLEFVNQLMENINVSVIMNVNLSEYKISLSYIKVLQSLKH